jgi:hypothetical protein
MTEEIIGKVNGLNLPGLTDKYYNLLFTERRIIGEAVGGNAAAFIVGGVIGAAVANAYHKGKSEQMNLKDPEEILSRNKKNFSLEYMDIDDIILKKKNMTISLNQKQKIVGKKAKFYFSKKQKSEIEPILMKVLPNKTIVK